MQCRQRCLSFRFSLVPQTVQVLGSITSAAALNPSVILSLISLTFARTILSPDVHENQQPIPPQQLMTWPVT